MEPEIEIRNRVFSRWPPSLQSQHFQLFLASLSDAAPRCSTVADHELYRAAFSALDLGSAYKEDSPTHKYLICLGSYLVSEEPSVFLAQFTDTL